MQVIKHDTLLCDQSSLLLLLKALADATRLDVLRVLRVDSYGVTELGRIFDMPQPGMSHHLKILLNAELVVTRREGNSIFYQRALIDNDDPLAALRQSLLDSLDQVPIAPATLRQVKQVQRGRAEHSLEYFKKNNGKFRQNQELIASFDQYQGSILELLDNLHLNSDSRAMEVGPGEGEFLRAIEHRFASLTALDNSADMLNKASANLAPTKIRFIKSDLNQAGELDIKVDLLIMNMVLHHLASPADAFARAELLLDTHGRLLITDLCSHDQDWVRANCGDIWLGFDPEDLNRWASDAGLQREQGIYLGLRNGFQIQISLFNKQTQINP